MNINPKVSAGAAAGAAAILVVFVLGLFGVPVPPLVAQALTTALAFAAGWLQPANQEGTPDGV